MFRHGFPPPGGMGSGQIQAQPGFNGQHGPPQQHLPPGSPPAPWPPHLRQGSFPAVPVGRPPMTGSAMPPQLADHARAPLQNAPFTSAPSFQAPGPVRGLPSLPTGAPPSSLSDGPPPPSDEAMLKNIELLADYVAKNGPRFEEMARAKEGDKPAFAFLVGGSPGTAAAAAREYYLWKKAQYQLRAASARNSSNVAQGQVTGADHVMKRPPAPTSPPAPPPAAANDDSDMEMEDDFAANPMSPAPVPAARESRGPSPSAGRLHNAASAATALASQHGGFGNGVGTSLQSAELSRSSNRASHLSGEAPDQQLPTDFQRPRVDGRRRTGFDRPEMQDVHPRSTQLPVAIGTPPDNEGAKAVGLAGRSDATTGMNSLQPARGGTGGQQDAARGAAEPRSGAAPLKLAQLCEAAASGELKVWQSTPSPPPRRSRWEETRSKSPQRRHQHSRSRSPPRRRSPDGAPRPSGRTPTFFQKGPPCKDFARGSCTYGSACRFSHGEDPRGSSRRDHVQDRGGDHWEGPRHAEGGGFTGPSHGFSGQGNTGRWGDAGRVGPEGGHRFGEHPLPGGSHPAELDGRPPMPGQQFEGRESNGHGLFNSNPPSISPAGKPPAGWTQGQVQGNIGPPPPSTFEPPLDPHRPRGPSPFTPPPQRWPNSWQQAQESLSAAGVPGPSPRPPHQAPPPHSFPTTPPPVRFPQPPLPPGQPPRPAGQPPPGQFFPPAGGPSSALGSLPPPPNHLPPRPPVDAAGQPAANAAPGPFAHHGQGPPVSQPSLGQPRPPQAQGHPQEPVQQPAPPQHHNEALPAPPPQSDPPHATSNSPPPPPPPPDIPPQPSAAGGENSPGDKKVSSKGLGLLRSAVADLVKDLLKPKWKEGQLSKENFKLIAKKAVDKVVGAIPEEKVPASQAAVDKWLSAGQREKITKLVQGYVKMYKS